MNPLLEQSVALLRKMVAIPSQSFSEDALVTYLFGTLSDMGLSPARYGNNLVCTCPNYNPSKPTLVLDAHIDTVPPCDGYTRDPYDPGDDAETVRGLGSNDDGGSVVSMIAVFRHFCGRDIPVNLVLDLNCEEERTGSGGDRFLFGPDGPSELRDAFYVIIGEPTGMDMAVSERGLLVIDGLASGVSGHAARGEGVNALYTALDDIARMRSHEFAKISPLMGKVGLNVTQISCGSAHNVIPDKCSFVVDVRPTEVYRPEEILCELQSLCRSKLTARSLDHPSSAARDFSPLVEAARQLGIRTFSSATTSNWTCTGWRDAVKMGPGDSSRSHRADEYVLVSELETAFEKYIALIETFYGNTLE